ncbi:MAG: ferritin-like domain-containing protein [Polyangiaceae bacterium]
MARAFQAAILAVGGPAVVVACSSGPAAAPDAGGSLDATLDTAVPKSGDTGAPVPDAGPSPPPHDASVPDVVKPKPIEAGPDGGCYAGSWELDSGPDSNPLTDVCAYVYACGLSGTGLGNLGCQVLLVVGDNELAPIPQTTCWLPQDAGCDDDALAPDNEAGGVTIYCTPCPAGGGRRPAGLRAPRGPRRRARAETALGGYFARMAFEEEASIVAFERMCAELGQLGAPAKLAGAAKRAARDETRHARVMAKLAVVHGGETVKPRVRAMHGRRAAAIAAENAAEGCVRETYGALVARWQSLHAGDVEVRRAFARIAVDEAKHAALSWALARWIEPRLDAAGKRRVARSRARALRALRTSVAIEPLLDLVRSAGLPPSAKARALLDAMTRELELAPPLSGGACR